MKDLAQSIRRVLAIAMLAVRAALRTKTVFVLFELLGVCVLLLPSVIKSDGTAEGSCQILLMYTIGFSFGLLCLSTLWASCALFAAEIDGLRIQLSAVKPVRALEFWLGKWFALLFLNALLLAFVYTGVYAQLRWQAFKHRWQDEITLATRNVARPRLPPPAQEARETYEWLKQRGELPKDMSERAIIRTLTERAKDRYDVINPGETVQWDFALDRPLQTNETLTVRIRFDTAYSARAEVTGLCRLTAGGQSIEEPLNDFSLNEIVFDVPGEAFNRARPPTAFTLSFQHTGDPAQSSALMLRFRQDVALLTRGGTFEANLLRSALIQWSVLSLLAAFGLTLSAGFSLPVAVFTATVLLMLVMVGNSVVKVISQEDEDVWMNRPGIWISRGVSAMTQHAMRDGPLEAVTRRERVEPNAVSTALLWNTVLTPALLALLGAHILRNRELASGN